MAAAFFPGPSTTNPVAACRKPQFYITGPFGSGIVTLPELNRAPVGCDGRVMVLLFCGGMVYTANELEFIVRIGWLPVAVLIKCSLVWLT